MVYIQSDAERKLPHHFDAACALYGAQDNGQEIRLTSFEEVQSGKFDSLIKSHLFVGSVEFMREVFSRAGKFPRLPKNSNRREEITTLGQARRTIEIVGPLFIKPVQTKLFSGAVYDPMFIGSLDKFDRDTEVIITQAFGQRILTEWRCYVHYNKIIDARNYSGDFKIAPNWDYGQSIINENSDFPDAYVVDLGVLENGANVVIEFNDMWVIGNYGIENSEYYKLLRARYFQIVRS
jgi:hypothetical protein